jgi:glycosidase
MHINSPTLQEHPDWHTDSILPDGRRNFELWDDARLTTWFDKHIPTLDLEREEVCEQMTDSALYWLANYELDGFRHDACKHIPERYWRMLGQKIATRWPGRPIWMIGETYGSPELIGSYIKSGMLNAQFDFNVYFTAREALCGLTGMDEVLSNELTSLATYGAHHTMGNISGNHDQIRFASIAGGAIDIHSYGKEEGWTQEIGIGDADVAYKRALLLEVLNSTLPGVPCIYQGDEYAEVGGNDPDNRHMMRFEGLNDEQIQMRKQVAELMAMRRHSMPLLYGDLIPLESSADLISYKRVYLGQAVVVTINRKELTYNISVE